MTSLKNSYSLVDIFCGSGGLSKGLSLSKFFVPVASIECNKAAADTYKKNFPTATVLETKVANVKGKELLAVARRNGFQKVDAICGGPPCRPFSKSNRGSTQWKVVKKIQNIAHHPDWVHFIRLIKELKPKFVVAENVMGFRSNKDVFTPFVFSLEKLGYTVTTPFVDIRKFGVPQKRKRIIILAIKGKVDRGRLMFSETPNEETLIRDAISDLPSLSNSKPGKQKSHYLKRQLPSYAKKLRGRTNVLYNHTVHSVNPIMLKRFKYIPQGYNLKTAWEAGKIPKTIFRSSYKHLGRTRRYTKKSLENIHSNIYRRLKWKETSPTLTHPRKTVIIHPTQNRLLSVRECARLQSFPDNFVFTGSINQQYQQIADAVPPYLAKQVGITIVKAIKDKNHQKPIAK